MITVTVSSKYQEHKRIPERYGYQDHPGRESFMDIVDSSGRLEYFAEGETAALQAVIIMQQGQVMELNTPLALTPV